VGHVAGVAGEVEEVERPLLAAVAELGLDGG
jgi:hypothetical protein